MKNYKLVIMLLCFFIITYVGVASEKESNSQRPLSGIDNKFDETQRPIRVVLQINGYTITITGNLNIHFMHQDVEFTGTISIVGNGINLIFNNVHYHGNGQNRQVTDRMTDEEAGLIIAEDILEQENL